MKKVAEFNIKKIIKDDKIDKEKDRAETYANAYKLDAEKYAKIAQTQSDKEAINAIFTGDNGQPLTYSEMRARYF